MKLSLSDNALTTAWITMLILLFLGIVGDFWKTFPLHLGDITIGVIIFLAGVVGMFEAFYEKGDGIGAKYFGQHGSNIITAVGSVASLLLGIGLLFNVPFILSLLSVWITLLIQFVILLLEGIVKRW